MKQIDWPRLAVVAIFTAVTTGLYLALAFIYVKGRAHGRTDICIAATLAGVIQGLWLLSGLLQNPKPKDPQ